MSDVLKRIGKWDAAVGVDHAVARAVAKERAAMLDRIEDLELQLASAIKERDEYRSRIDAMFWCEACDRLEIGRTTSENAVHDAIERGEHRREEEE